MFPTAAPGPRSIRMEVAVTCSGAVGFCALQLVISKHLFMDQLPWNGGTRSCSGVLIPQVSG